MNATLPLAELSRFDEGLRSERTRGLFPPPGRLRLQVATPRQREMIYQLRHEIYAQELGQHPLNPRGRLTDALDEFNHYLVALLDGELAGFISVTPPGRDRYSLDKYVARERLPFAFDAQLYEVRLLTVIKPHRGRPVAAALMYAAFRWVEAHGGTRLIAIGRREVLSVYLKAGLQPVGLTIQSGAVTFEVLHTTTAALRAGLERFDGMLDKLERQIDWRLEFSFHQPAPCFHGGAFFAAIGDEFDALDRRHAIVNADVLDAWFPPAPNVTATLSAHLPWLLQTSPPTGCEGLVRAIARARGVAPASVLSGAGSSALIFLAFGR